MMWLCHKVYANHRLMSLAVARHAKTVIHFMEDEKVIKALEATEVYGLGGVAVPTEIFSVSLSPSYCTSFSRKELSHDSATAACKYTYGYSSKPWLAAASSSDAAYDSVLNQKQSADICREILTEEFNKKLKELGL